MEQIKIQRPHSLSLVYHMSDEVYESVLECASKYSYTGIDMWNEFSENFVLSNVRLGVLQSVLANVGAMQTTNFDNIYEFVMGISLLDAIGNNKPRRDWPKVYADLVEAGMRNRKHNGDETVDWVLDGVIINKEPNPAPAL